MIEITVKEYLDKKMEVPVYYEVPSRAPGKYITLEKIGGGGQNFIKTATFAIQSRAESLHGAAELNEAVKAAMDDIIELNGITKSSLNSDYNFTDTTTKKYRYQAVYDLVFY